MLILGDKIREHMIDSAWGMRNVYNSLVGNPEGKRPLRRPRHRWKDNIRTDLREIGWEDVDWVHLDQDGDQ
jgi:hypothetical protein